MTNKISKRARYRLAVLTSHPIQYQAPLFSALASRPEIDLHVFFCCRWGVEHYRDPGFGVSFSWDTPLLQGYSYTFLPNLSPCPGTTRFLGIMNPGIVSVILRGKFDALWIHGWALASNWIAWATATSNSLPILLRGESNGLGEPKGLKGILKRSVLKTFFKQIAGFLAVGTNNTNFYRSYGVPTERIFWTPYTIDTHFFMGHAKSLEGQKRSLREKAGIPLNLPVVLFCGKFLEQKCPFDLLKAFVLLCGYCKVSLVFVGDGPLRDAMEAFVAERRLENIYFFGFRNQSELPACYALADVFVLPSSFEPWGLVLNEAMCFGLPVIASDQVGAAADLVRQGLNGFVYPVGNIEALADRLHSALADERTRQAMGCQSQAVISHWGIEEDVEGVLMALHAVVDKRI